MKKTKSVFILRKSPFRVLLTVLILQFTWAGLSSQENQAKNSPVFSNFVYQGDDQVYKDHPLKPGEFYNPILQGCYPDPVLPEKAMIITWYAPPLPCSPECLFFIQKIL